MYRTVNPTDARTYLKKWYTSATRSRIRSFMNLSASTRWSPRRPLKRGAMTLPSA
ncbi:MAG: transposase [Actinobacteria bacterium]|nr:transposase [Actinomycetota bacterium]